MTKTQTEQPQEKSTGTRREPRHRVEKQIQVTVKGVTVQATLVDESLHGFRIRLVPGSVRRDQVITLHFPWGNVNATVVWTRDAGEYSEAGLLVP